MLITRFHTFVSAVCLAAVLGGCEKPADRPPDAAPKVSGESLSFQADNPQLQNIATDAVRPPQARELRLPGRLVWDEDHTVRVYSPFAGRVGRILVSSGQRVAAGQVLAELVSPDYGQAQADARKARADFNTKSTQLQRTRELSAAGVVATRELQQAEADFQAAEAEFNRASARLAASGGGDAVDQRYLLRSPIAGMVVERNINPGQELRPDQPGAPLFVVTDPSLLWVQLDANEADLPALAPGSLLVVSSNLFPEETFAGQLQQVAAFIDPVTRTLKMRGTVANRDLRLKAEMFINARIALPRGNFPMVPDKAVFLDGLRRYVFVRNSPTTFSRRPVRVGNVADELVPVLSGLKEGDEVVVSGALYLQQLLGSAGGRTDSPDKRPVETGTKK